MYFKTANTYDKPLLSEVFQSHNFLLDKLSKFSHNFSMKLQQRFNDRFNIRVRAVKKYLEFGSLEEVASSFYIHSTTLRRWIKRYQESGEDNLRTRKTYARHAKRFEASIEKKIVLLKEKNPSITLIEARNTLNKNRINISLKGIWSIWKRYNLTGSYKNISHRAAINLEVEDGIRRAEEVLNNGNIKKASEILNKLPSCEGQSILKKIPDRF